MKKAVINGLSSKFTLIFRVKNSDEATVAEILRANFAEHFYTIKKCEFIGFKRVTISSISIRQAEVLRVLLKQIKTYE